MKVIPIGDIHGRDFWKKAQNIEADKIIFLGDYFDSREEISGFQQLNNLKEIVNWKKSDSRVELLLGNHDYHYLRGIPWGEQYSGFQSIHKIDFQEYLENNINLFSVVHIIENYIFSHAGVTRDWMTRIKLESIDNINERFNMSRKDFGFYGFSFIGDDPGNGPLWVRPRSLLNNMVKNFNQVVGHTAVPTIHSNKGLTTKNIVYFCDTEDHSFNILDI